MLINICWRIIQQQERKRLCNEILSNIRKSRRICNADLNIWINISGSELNLHRLDSVRIGIIDREFNLRIECFWAEWEKIRTVEHTSTILLESQIRYILWSESGFIAFSSLWDMIRCLHV